MNLDRAYNSAIDFAQSHYENFPVISKFLPKEIRKHIAVVYQFARQADDLADEGEVSDELRTKNLELYEKKLELSLNEKPESEFWFALSSTIKTKNLTPKYFYDLIDAFKQDIVKKRYTDSEELLNYCSRSANPVGRIILELYEIRNEKELFYSDQICTALQLTNFYQDVSVDILKGRIYIPITEMKKFGLDDFWIISKKHDENSKKLVTELVQQTDSMFDEGKKLLPSVPFLLRMQLKLTIIGGKKILEKIKMNDYNVVEKRPVLSRRDILESLIKLFVKI
ncbi:MAG: squalene synthase HpnC [Melioribacteraceae bacterium]|nr:squalene synthase HpnC [Melioribacteraceae bacterium]